MARRGSRRPREGELAQHRIAVIPGDGIGKEVVPEGLRVLDAAARKFKVELQLDHFDWSCDYYLKHGTMMPENWKEQIGSMTRSSSAPSAGPRRCPTMSRSGAR